MEGTEAINILKSGDDLALSTLYKMHRPAFFAWFKRHSAMDESISSSLYQEAFIIMFEHVRNGKLSQLDSKVGTYLIGIGKNLAKARRNSTWAMRVEKTDFQTELFDVEVPINESSPEIDKLVVVFEKMGEKCKSILTLYYYQNFSMEAIAIRLGFKNEAVAKKSKYECLQKLKQNYHQV